MFEKSERTRVDVINSLKKHGIKYNPYGKKAELEETLKAGLEKLGDLPATPYDQPPVEPPVEPPTEPKEAPEATEVVSPQAAIMEILQDIAKDVGELSSRVKILEAQKANTVSPGVQVTLEQPQAITTNAPSTTTMPEVTVGAPDMFQQVPPAIKQAATEILGQKFGFEVQSLPDRPAFVFTIIVPAEYSPYKGAEVDRRSKIIENALGLNGVRDWSLKVKENVLSYLGQNLVNTTL